ncbi:FkbM family methyltransferase [Kordiimonas gwangyangensis]|uniref:FkbM family methyltransferase n=1 Tax=Kordiimonas gwangyangensis TaxID=288022 RepID=UPI00037F102C|nr:FkbM family methyltransferase [Kordiimonas gwangyangensis]
MTGQPPKKPEKTILETVNHFLTSHPELVAPVQTIVSEKWGRHPYDVNFIYELNKSLLAKSEAQLRQDIFVLHHLGFKRDGFFVEFGAASGRALSNTYLLEKEFNWSGIVAEPARHWHEMLAANRSCHIETACVWHTSGERLMFLEVANPELSSIDHFADADSHAKDRREGHNYEVETISLMDLLEKYDAPKRIDYLSVDTEGSEFEILQAFDFGRYDIEVITVEHNFTAQRDELYRLLTSNGYVRTLEHISRFDDWYIKRT